MATRQTDLSQIMRGYSAKPLDGTVCNQPWFINLKVKVDEDHVVEPDESDVVDLVALIQTYKDQCGMELAKKLIKTGQVDPSYFADDKQHSFDDANIPDSRQGIDNAVIQSSVQVDRLKALFGIPQNADLSEEQVNELIASYVSKNQDKFVKAASVEPSDAPKE